MLDTISMPITPADDTAALSRLQPLRCCLLRQLLDAMPISMFFAVLPSPAAAITSPPLRCYIDALLLTRRAARQHKWLLIRHYASACVDIERDAFFSLPLMRRRYLRYMLA